MALIVVVVEMVSSTVSTITLFVSGFGVRMDDNWVPVTLRVAIVIRCVASGTLSYLGCRSSWGIGSSCTTRGWMDGIVLIVLRMASSDAVMWSPLTSDVVVVVVMVLRKSALTLGLVSFSLLLMCTEGNCGDDRCRTGN